MRGTKRAIKATNSVNAQKYKSAPKRGGFDNRVALNNIAKPRNARKDQRGVAKRADGANEKNMLFFDALF